MAKVIVFKKNTPWGTVRDARNNIVYRHIINFIDENNNFSQALKDEFVNEFLCEQGENYKTLLDQGEQINFKYIDELNIQFTATIKNQNNRFSSTEQLEMSDFAVVKVNNEIRFYVLSVLERTAKRIVFVGNIDIFFTYNLEFNNQRKNYIIQSHIDRFSSELNPTWEEQMIEEDYRVPLLISENKVVQWDYPFAASVSISDKEKFDKIKWFVVYFKAQTFGSQKSKNNEVLSNTTGLDVRDKLYNLPFNIIFWPVDFEGNDTFLIKKNDADGGEHIDFNNLLISALVDNELILSIKLMDVLPFNLFGDYPNAEISRAGNKWIFNFKSQHWLNPFKFVDEFKFAGNFKVGDTVKTSSTADIFVVGEMNEFQYDKHFLTSKSITTIQPKKPDSSIQIIQKSDLDYETKLFTVPFLCYILKWWNSDMKVYNLPFLKDGKVKLISALNGENDSMLAFMETTNQDVIINNSNLLMSAGVNEVPTKTDAYLNYMRKNQSQIAIQEKYAGISIGFGALFTAIGAVSSAVNMTSRVRSFRNQKKSFTHDLKQKRADLRSQDLTAAQRRSSISRFKADNRPSNMGLIGGLVSDASSLLMGAGVSAIISGVRSLETIEAVQEDLSRQSPAINPGNNLFINLVLNKTKKNELNYIIQRPNPVHRQQAGDNMSMYGYKVLQLKKLKDIINSRYLHNYIVALDVFNSIDNKLSVKIKEIITNAFSEGLSIWHYRSKQNWKGILSYEWENWEMSVLKKLNKI